MKFFTDKKTNDVYVYDTIEDAKRLNKSFDDLIELTDDLIEQFKNPVQYAKWTIDGWVVDEELKLKQQREEIEQRIQFLRNEIIYLTALGDDVSKEVEETKLLREKLKKLKAKD